MTPATILKTLNLTENEGRRCAEESLTRTGAFGSRSPDFQRLGCVFGASIDCPEDVGRLPLRFVLQVSIPRRGGGLAVPEQLRKSFGSRHHLIIGLLIHNQLIYPMVFAPNSTVKL